MTSLTQKKARAASSPVKSTAKAAAETPSLQVALNEPAGFAGRLHSAVRWLLLIFAATLPFYYDLGVPEVSGDIRWLATEFYAGTCAILMLAAAILGGQTQVRLRWPAMMWFALGLCLWAAISILDAINPSRAIILIKAMYAQVILMVIVFRLATPAFGRKLLWAMIVPLFFTSAIGMLQFHGMNDAKLAAALDSDWALMWLKPIVWVLDAFAGTVSPHLSWIGREVGIATLTVSTFLQSAVPGSTFANKNLAGSWTAMMLPIALYLLITSKKWPAQALASILLAMGSLFLIYSRARASWVALFCAGVTMIALFVLVPAWRQAIWRHFDRSHLLWLLLPVLFIARWGGDVSPVNGSYAIDRTPSEQVAALAGSSWDEIGGRLAYNLNSLVITKDYWFNGVGLGNFYAIYPPYYNDIVVTPWNSYNVMARPQRTHTDLMQAFDEMGIIGGIMYAGMFISAIAMGLRMAGRRAGALGGYLIGAGMMTMFTALAVFLEHQDMLALPGMWHYVLIASMLSFIVAMLFGALRSYRAVCTEHKPADDIQLLGFMTAIGVLTICINALFDFPMQLPTAPAAAVMMMGIVAAIYMRYQPQEAVGFDKVLPLGRQGFAALMAVVIVASGVALWDGLKFRESNVLLKKGMIRLFSGINDEDTVDILEKAWKTYPYDQRIQEHLGVAYANYNGVMPVSLDTRIAKLEWAMSGDPWGANHMINLSGLYLQKAVLLKNQGLNAEADTYLQKTEALFEKLKQNADFSHYTWGIGGTLRNMQGRYDDAMWMFRRALAITPDYLPARAGLMLAVSESGIRPAVVQDGMMQAR